MQATSIPADARPIAFDQAGFHEATLLAIELAAPGCVTLILDDVLLGDERRRVQVTLREVEKLERDGLPVRELIMEMPDAEVLALRSTGRATWQLLLLWNDFARRLSQTVCYGITARQVDLHVLPAPG
jgi:hypothetical protein